MEVDVLSDAQRATLRRIKLRKVKVVALHRAKKSTANNRPVLPRGADANRTSNTANMKVRIVLAKKVFINL